MSLPALFEVFLPTWANVHQWLALACVLVVVHKLHGLWRTRRTQFRVTEIFSGSKGHWLFGNILEVRSESVTMLVHIRLCYIRCKITEAVIRWKFAASFSHAVVVLLKRQYRTLTVV